jgi:hypothetical protein
LTEQRTLDDLDPPAWGPPTYDSYLVTRCHELRTKPLGEFTVEDLRIMIGQQIGLPHLIPLAVDELYKNPLAEGDFYPGDLLCYVLRIDPAVWQNNSNLAAKLDLALDRLPEDLGLDDQTDRELRDLIARFRAYARTLRGR